MAHYLQKSSLCCLVALLMISGSSRLLAAEGSGAWIATLLEPPNQAAERTAAEELGNAFMKGGFELSEEERLQLEIYILRCFARSKARTAEERLEARRQIERLWHAAVPTLLKQLGNADPTQLELAIKSLLLMRDEKIIQSLIDQGLATQEAAERKWIVFTLTKMNEPREALVPDRHCLNKEKSAELFERLVQPALRKFAAREK